jgi:hypothetical protein
MKRELERLRAEAERAIDCAVFYNTSLREANEEKEKLRRKIDIIVQKAYGKKEE